MEDLSEKFELIEKELERASEEGLGLKSDNNAPVDLFASDAHVQEILIWGSGKKVKDSNWVQNSLNKVFSTVYPNKRKNIFVKNLSSKACYTYIDHKKSYIKLFKNIKKLVYIHQGQFNVLMNEYCYGTKLDFFFILDVNDEKYFEQKSKIMTSVKFIKDNILRKMVKSQVLDRVVYFKGQKYQLCGLTSYQKHHEFLKSHDHEKPITASLNP